MPQKGQIKRAFPLQSRRQHRESHIMMLPSVQFPVPGTCSSRVSWAKCPSILFITKWIFPGVLKIILWHILSLPTSCKELLNSQRKNNFSLILTLNVIALWTCTSVSPWLQHSEKETVKQLLIPEYKQKKIKNILKTEALNITLFLWDIRKGINHQSLRFYYLSGWHYRYQALFHGCIYYHTFKIKER